MSLIHKQIIFQIDEANVLKFLEQNFTINHSSYAQGSDSCVFTEFQEMFWETIR